MKVMIVEDDLLVRLGIKSMIPWGNMGLEVACEARDGVEALDLFARHQPDIAFVDIGLPHMNGLEFIQQAKKINARAEFIVITCNQDFEMARRSLRLGVHDFVMKSTMEIEELQGILHKLVTQMREHAAANQAFRNSRPPEVKSEELQKSFLRDWLNGLYAHTETIARKMDEVGIDCLQKEFQAWIIRLDTLSRNGEALLPADLGKIGYAICNIAKELFREYWLGTVEDVRERQWHAILHSDSRSIQPEALIDAVRVYLGYEISIGCSVPFRLSNEWHRFDRTAEEMLSQQGFLKVKNKWIAAVEEYIEQHPYEDISLNYIAEELKVSPAYLSRLFKEETGKNFTDYMMSRKVAKAIQLMKSGIGITEIAERLGYLNLSSFTRMFKKMSGIAPSNYVKKR
jgi:two-component system, response regulator YesN